MRIIGIDPALTVTGYGLIDCEGCAYRLVEAGIIKTDERQATPERLRRIHEGVVGILREFRPQVMVLEKLYAHYRHPVTSFLLGQARGVICLACAEEKVSFFEYPATRVKKALVGKGLAAKYQVQRMVVGLLGLRMVPAYADVTDALALAIAHSHMGATDARGADRIK